MDFKLDICPFNGDGLIPPGDYLPTKTDFENNFVTNRKREVLYENFNIFLFDLQNTGIDESSLVNCDGSFTTNKKNPSDVDLTVDIFLENLSNEEVFKNKDILNFVQDPSIKSKYKCHVFHIIILPVNDPNYQRVTGEMIKYWYKWFGRDREDREKGRIWLEVGGLR